MTAAGAAAATVRAVDSRWSHFALFGWGLGLGIHGLVTVIALQGEGVRRSLLAREIESLRRTER